MLWKFRFRTKIILTQNIIILLVVMLLGGVFYQRTLLTMSEKSLEDFKIISDSVANQLDYHFYTMDRTALQIAANPNIVNLFRRLTESSETNYFIEEPLENAEFVELLNSYNFKKDGLKRICLYNQYHDFVYTATDVTTISGIERWISSDTLKKVEKYFDNEHHYVYYMWLNEDILNDTEIKGKPFFSVIRQIKNHITNENVYAYVEVQENVEKLERYTDSVDGHIHVALLRDRDVIYINSAKESKVFIEQIVKMSEEGIIIDGVVEKISGYFAYVRKLDNAPYKMIFIKEKGAELVLFNQYNIIILFILILILGIAMISEIIITRKLAKPLDQLSQFVKVMTQENPQLEIKQWQNNDEFVRIQSAFNTMVQQMQDAIKREYISNINGLKAQLFALQSQMHPHFLYNMLASISIAAQLEENDRIPSICTRLRRMIDYGSHMGDGYSALKKEVEYVLDYMDLMKVRYGESFQYVMDIDDGLCDIKIPKYIIQPICENSFKHSFMKIEPIWRLKILIYKRDNRWIIEIHDNGIGFSEEYLDVFAQKVKNFTLLQTQDNLEKGTMEGMGIWNIYMRMMICYGNDFIFQLYNDEEGAVVLIGGEIR